MCYILYSDNHQGLNLNLSVIDRYQLIAVLCVPPEIYNQKNILQLEYLSLCYLAGGALLLFLGVVAVDWCFMTVSQSV